MDQLQLLVFSALAFSVLIRTGIYPPELKAVNLDFDWTYRKLAPALVGAVGQALSSLLSAGGAWIGSSSERTLRTLRRHHGPDSALARTWPTGSMALWVMILLLAYLLAYYV